MISRSWSRSAATGSVVLLLVGLCASTAWGANDTAVREETILRVCARNNPPFMFVDDRGIQQGLEYDLLTAFAAKAGIELQIEMAESFASVFTQLQAGSCDLGAATITKTVEREAWVDFSTSYFPVRIVTVDRSSDPLAMTVESLSGRLAATIRGSTYEQALARIADIRVSHVANSLAMFDAVSNGKADFLACDSAIVLALIGGFPNLRIGFPLSERDEVAFALRKGSAWRQPLNDFLAHTRESGEMRKMLSRYFGDEGANTILSDEEASEAGEH